MTMVGRGKGGEGGVIIHINNTNPGLDDVHMCRKGDKDFSVVFEYLMAPKKQ